MATGAQFPAATLALLWVATACAGDVSGPAEDDFGATWRGSFTCGEATGAINPTLNQSGAEVSGFVRLTVELEDGTPNVGKTWSVSGTVGPSGDLLLQNEGAPFGLSALLPHGLLPDTLEIQATLAPDAERIMGTLAPCSGGSGSFSAERHRFTGFK